MKSAQEIISSNRNKSILDKYCRVVEYKTKPITKEPRNKAWFTGKSIGDEDDPLKVNFLFESGDYHHKNPDFCRKGMIIKHSFILSDDRYITAEVNWRYNYFFDYVMNAHFNK